MPRGEVNRVGFERIEQDKRVLCVRLSEGAQQSDKVTQQLQRRRSSARTCRLVDVVVKVRASQVRRGRGRQHARAPPERPQGLRSSGRPAQPQDANLSHASAVLRDPLSQSLGHSDASTADGEVERSKSRRADFVHSHSLRLSRPAARRSLRHGVQRPAQPRSRASRFDRLERSNGLPTSRRRLTRRRRAPNRSWVRLRTLSGAGPLALDHA